MAIILASFLVVKTLVAAGYEVVTLALFLVVVSMVTVVNEVVTRGIGCLAVVSLVAAANPFAHFASFIGRQFVQDFFAFT